MSESRESILEKIIEENKVGDNVIVVLSLPNGGLATEDSGQIGLTVSSEKSISSAKIRKHLEGNGWIDLGSRPYDREGYDELDGRVWIKK